MRYGTPRLLTPPREEEEIYPYRRVWPSLALEIGALFGLTIILYVMVGYLGIGLPVNLERPVNVGIALFPALLWVLFSLWRERFVVEPRRNLVQVFIVSALVANAVGVPLVNSLEIDQWLPFLGTIERVIGYAVTLGIVQEMLKYLVVRYLVWPAAFRIRLDSVAYLMAAAISYATVLDLRAAMGAPVSPDVFAIRMLGNTTSHIAASIFVSYGLAEVRFNPRTFFVMPIALLFASVITGLAVSARASMMNTAFVLGFAATRPLFGIVLSLMVVVGALMIAAFLFNAAERQEREALAGSEA